MTIRDQRIATMTRKERMEHNLAFEQRSMEIQLHELQVRLKGLGRHADDKKFGPATIPAIQGEVNEVTRTLNLLADLNGRMDAIRDCIEIEEDKR